MSSPFPNSRQRGSETLLSPAPPTGRSAHDDMLREIARGTGRHVEPPPPLARQTSNIGADVGSLAMPQEPELVAVTAEERELFEAVGPSYNTAAVAAYRATRIAGPLAVDADLDDAITFGDMRRQTAEYGTLDVGVERLKNDAARLEAQAVDAPPYAVDSLVRAAAELRTRINRIEALAPRVFALRLARRRYERAIECERVARTDMSVAEVSAGAIVAGPTELLRLAKIEADNVLAGPIRAHADAVAVLDSAKDALRTAQARV